MCFHRKVRVCYFIWSLDNWGHQHPGDRLLRGFWRRQHGPSGRRQGEGSCCSSSSSATAVPAKGSPPRRLRFQRWWGKVSDNDIIKGVIKVSALGRVLCDRDTDKALLQAQKLLTAYKVTHFNTQHLPWKIIRWSNLSALITSIELLILRN